MRLNLFKGILFLFFYCFNIQLLSAADIPVKYLGIEQGLSNNAVISINQDHNGFMWFGTYDGLNRYDGYGFKIFHNIIGDNTSLSINNIYSIEADWNHNLWVGGQKGLSVYDPVKSIFSSVKYISQSGSKETLQDNIHTIKSVNHGIMLVGTQHNGLLEFVKDSKVGIQRILNQKDVNYDVTAIAFDTSETQIWVFIQHRGLYLYDLKNGKLILVNNLIKQANCIKVDKKGQLWLANDYGLYLYNELTKSFSKSYLPIKSSIITLCSDKYNNLWIGSDGAGLWLLSSGESLAKPYVSNKGKSLVNSNSIYAIYEDIEGRKWIGTLRGGINIIEPENNYFENITYHNAGENNLVDNFILSFCEDDKKNVWIGTDGAGLRYWNRSKNTFTEYKYNPEDKHSISSNFITSIIKDYLGDLWITTWFGGLSRLQKRSNTFERYTCYNSKTDAEENNVWLVYEDLQKRLWASATNEGSLYLFNRKSNRFELFDNNIVNLQSIAEDKEGNFWGGNYGSLIKIDRVSKINNTYTIGYPVRCIHEDQKNNFWIGTQGGGLLLFDRRNGHYIRYTTKEGLPSNTILRFLEDSNGNLWLSTYNGLSKFNIQTRSCRNFSQMDGLQSNQFSFNAALALSSGEFLFGGIKGFNQFFPDSIQYHSETPAIFLNQLKVNNIQVESDNTIVTERELEKINQITVPFDKAVISIEYIALTYNARDKISYAYFLEGWDKGWNYVNDLRTANYSKLQEGKYVFKLKVTNPDGKWSKETQLLKIIVLPPWYRSWWAILLYVLIFSLFVYIYIWYTKKQERLKYEIKLAHLESEEEKKLVEKKVTFFTNIAHEFRAPLTLIIDPLKRAINNKENVTDKNDLTVAHRNARRLLSLVDQLLLFRKADTGNDVLKISELNIVFLCDEVFQCFTQQAKTRKINYSFMASQDDIGIYGDYEKIEIALFNLLSNAFKFTPDNGSILFSVSQNESEVMISVKDSGCGIGEADADRIFEKFQQANSPELQKTGFGIGLYLVKHFIENHKGRITFTSKETEGSTFNLFLLKGKDYLTGNYIMLGNKNNFELFNELLEESAVDTTKPITPIAGKLAEEVVTDKKIILVIDNDNEMRKYLIHLFSPKYFLYSAENGNEGMELAVRYLPDLIICDINMNGMSGIELCAEVKHSETLDHIPVILLTAATNEEIKLKGIEVGADDYITKPFDSDLLLAKVETIIKNRGLLRRYFMDSITLKETPVKVPAEFQEFLRKCIGVIEENIDNEEFSIKKFSKAMGMSHSGLYQKVKAISGQTLNAFIRSIRLRRAAVLMLTENMNVNQAAFQVGIGDVRYFREQFVKLFGITPSEYIKRHRNTFNSDLNTIREV